MQHFKSSFLGNEILLSDKCNFIWGASREGRIYEEPLINEFYKRIIFNKEQINFLDIGSNTGGFIFLPLVNRTIKCYAFEPNPIAFSALVENVELNNLKDNVECFNMGMWNESSELELKVPSDTTDSGLATMGNDPSRFIYDNKTGDFSTHTVYCTTIDEFFEQHKLESIDAIKIDTEGAELNILKGGEKTLKEFKPLLVLEFHTPTTLQFGYKREAILELLQSYGYTNFQLAGQSDLFASTL
jgi:FkbM family methyltransferase